MSGRGWGRLKGEWEGLGKELRQRNQSKEWI